VAALASTPAFASLGTSDQIEQAGAIQPATYAEPEIQPAATSCGQPQNMMLILRDDTGAIVATAVVRVTPDC